MESVNILSHQVATVKQYVAYIMMLIMWRFM